MKSITLYNEIKALVRESLEAEANAAAWKKIAKDQKAEARMLTATAKKMQANQGIEFDFDSLLTFITADLAEEAAPKSQEDTDLTDYRPGDFPASEDNSDEVHELSTTTVANEEATNESENL